MQALLQQIPLFSALNDQQMASLAAHTHRLNIGRHHMLFQKGDPAEGFYFVIEGQIKLFHLTEDGQERVLEIINPGMSFGEAVTLIGRPFPANAQATQRTELLYIERTALLELLKTYPDLSLTMLASLSRRLHGLVQDIENITLRSSSQRVIGYLLSLSDAHEGVSEFDLPASKALIASRLNQTPETFSRVLHGIQEESLIEVDGRHIRILDLNRLRNFGH